MTNVLYIDDRSKLSAFIRLYLANYPDIRVERVFSARTALEKMVKNRFDGVVCTHAIEGMDIIRPRANEQAAPVLVVRSYGLQVPARSPGKVTIEGDHCSLEFFFQPKRDIKPQIAEIVHYIMQFMQGDKRPAMTGRDSGVLRTIVQDMKIAFGVLVTNTFEWVNTDCAVLFGYSQQEMRGKHIRDLFAGEEEYVRFWREAGGRRDAAGWGQAEVSLQGRDVTRIPCIIRLHRINPVNPTKGHIILIEDISERERLEEKIREQDDTLRLSASRYQESLETMHAAIIRTDLEGEISLFNEMAGQVFGYAPEETIGMNIVGTIVPPGSRYAREMLTLINDVASETGGNLLQAFENTKKNGEKFWMAWNTLPLRDAEGRITQVLLIGQDITGHDAEGKRAIRTNPWKYQALEGTDVSEEVFDQVFHICIEISREGRESKKIGTSFVMGDTEQVMSHSRQCAINAFGGIPEDQRRVQQQDNKENIKNFAQLDGAFVIRGDGVIVASSRHFTIDAGEIDLPMGYGTRHASVAGITKKTKSVGLVVSESGGTITVFRRGTIVKQVIA